MTSFKSVISMALFALAPMAASAQSAETPCGSFSLSPVYVTVDTITASDEEVSFGDKRILHISLVDSDGKEVAEYFAENTVVPGGSDDRHQLLTSGRMVFPGGALSVSGTYHRPNITSSLPEAAPEFSFALHAGTGDFVGYAGEVHLNRDSDGKRLYNFDFPCP
ncbi:MAG: hypothetical protein AAGF94_09365 [Pseudomonadota bacterium]